MSLLWYSAMFLTDTPPTRTDVVSKTIQSFIYNFEVKCALDLYIRSFRHDLNSPKVAVKSMEKIE